MHNLVKDKKTIKPNQTEEESITRKKNHQMMEITNLRSLLTFYDLY